MRRSLEIARIAAVLGSMACDTAPKAQGPAPYPAPDVAKGGETVARIGPVVLTTEEIDRRIQKQSPFMRARLEDGEQRQRFVENEIRMELLAQEGWRRGLSEDPRVIAELKRIIVQRLMNEKLEELSRAVEISEGELLRAYRARENEYNKPPKVRLSVIARHASTPAEKKAATQRLEAVKKQLSEPRRGRGGPTFEKIAGELSEDPSAANDGNLDFLTREEVSKRFGAAAGDRLFEGAEIGELMIVETDDTVSLLKKTGARRGQERTLEMVRPQLRAELLRDKRTEAFDAFVEALSKEHGVVLHMDRVDALRIERPVAAEDARESGTK